MNEREHAVLSLFYDEGNREVTPSFLAYRMRISVRDATSLLDGMVKNDILDLHVDDDGHIVYRLPAAERARTEQYRQRQPRPGRHQRPDGGDAPRERPRQRPPQHHPPGGTDATPGFGDTASTAQATAASRSAHDGTDGSVQGAVTPSWTTPEPQAHPEAPYQDWYAAGEAGAYDKAAQAHHRGAPTTTTAPGGQPRRSAAHMVDHHTSMPDGKALTPYQSARHPAHPLHQTTKRERIPVLAGALSLLVPGLGQFYNGEIGKGVMLLFSCLFLWVFLLFWIVWIWSVIDAYMVAEQANQRALGDDSASPRPLLTDQRTHSSNPNSNAA